MNETRSTAVFVEGLTAFPIEYLYCCRTLVPQPGDLFEDTFWPKGDAFVSGEDSKSF